LYKNGVDKMPIIRKLIILKTSRAICIPKSWLENAEEEAGKKIIAMALEVNGVITLQPVFEKVKIAEPLEVQQ
jgi:hypothetical protein